MFRLMDKRNQKRTDSAGVRLKPLQGSDKTAPAGVSRLAREIKLKKRCIANASEYASNQMIAKKSGVSRTTLNRWLRNDPEFEEAFLANKENFGDKLEDVVVDRVLHGTLKPIVSNGKLVTYERQYSDRLTEMALRGRNKQYDNRPVQQSGIAAIAGGYQRLAARLRLIASRDETRVVPGDDDK